jgi:hypothetical protein
MKLNHFALVNGSKLDSFGRRKKERDSIRIDAAIKAALDELDHHEEAPNAFLRLVAHVRSCTTLLKPATNRGTPGWVSPLFFINRLKNLALRQRHWIRPCETWSASQGSGRPAFHALAEHLLARYPVPRFMDSVWDVPNGPEGFRQHSWFIRLGYGASFRSLNLPFPITRRMEHHVRHAPDHYSALQALRYGEILGSGGSERLAREVVTGRLGSKMEHPDFWRTVLAFFAINPTMDLTHVNPIIDFIHANKFAGDEVLTANGTETRAAPWPDFSIKGRSLKAILRLVTAWHADLAITKESPWCAWRKSLIPGYQFLEKRPGEQSDLDWTVQQLLDSGALHAEGRAMNHCVYSYTNRCRRGETTIWSLRLRAGGEEKRMVTIEVDPHKRAIVQAKARCNRWPGARSCAIIRQWASQAGLRLDIEG